LAGVPRRCCCGGEPFDMVVEPFDRAGEPFDRAGEPFDRGVALLRNGGAIKDASIDSPVLDGAACTGRLASIGEWSGGRFMDPTDICQD
jgi:hypothetical protein